jgi:hypothetical protein
VTCTVENAHLAEISLVWSGGLPGAKLSDEMFCEISDGNEKVMVGTSWDEIKGLGMEINLCSTLSMPISGIPRRAVGLSDENNYPGGEDMTFEEALEAFKDQLSAMFIPKEEHDKLTKQFGDLNAEVEGNKEFVVVGQKRFTELLQEYHRLGVVLYGEKWDQEAKDAVLNAFEPIERETILNAEIKTMKEDAFKLMTPKKEEDPGHKDDKPYDHKQNPDLYKIGK